VLNPYHHCGFQRTASTSSSNSQKDPEIGAWQRFEEKLRAECHNAAGWDRLKGSGLLIALRKHNDPSEPGDEASALPSVRIHPPVEVANAYLQIADLIGQ